MRTILFSLAGMALLLASFGLSHLRENTQSVGSTAALLYSIPGGASTSPGQYKALIAYQPPAGSVILEVENQLQYPELPCGSEATALSTLLRWHGLYADNVQLAHDYMPREEVVTLNGERYGPDPAAAYAGDPTSRDEGWYCGPTVVCETAVNYLGSEYIPAHVQDLSGISLDGLIGQLQGETPVIAWCTLDNGPLRYQNTGWLLEDGSHYLPTMNQHCVVVVGYDDTGLYICDPLMEGIVRVEQQQFAIGYNAMGCKAVTIELL